MDNVKNDNYYIQKIKKDLEFIVVHMQNVDIEEKYIDSKGKLNLQQCGLMAFAHGEYFALGRKTGDFGFSVRKKKKHRKS